MRRLSGTAGIQRAGTAVWPANLAPRADGAYHIFFVGDRPQRRITLRVLANLPADDDVLTKLRELGCKH